MIRFKKSKKILAAILTAGMLLAGNGVPICAAEPVSVVQTEEQLNYLVVGSPVVCTPGSQFVLADVGDGTEKLSDAVLTYVNVETGTSYEVTADTVDEGSLLFNMEFDDTQPSGEYEVTTIEVVADGEKRIVRMVDTGIEAKFGINTDVDSEADAYVVDEQAEQDAEEACGEDGITVLDAEGQEMTFDSLTEALQEADDSVADSGIATQSTVNPNLVVVLDPGHGGSDPGACKYGLREADLTLKIAQYCKSKLEEYSHVEVYMTRTADTDNNLANRVAYAKKFNPDVFVSIHINAVGGQHGGAEVYYPNGNYIPGIGTEGKELAEVIQQKLVALGLYNRGIKIRNTEDGSQYPDGSPSDYLGVIKRSKEAGFPAVLIEHAFIDNSGDVYNFLSREDKVKEMGYADATAIAEYYGLSKNGNYGSKATIADTIRTAYDGGTSEALTPIMTTPTTSVDRMVSYYKSNATFPNYYQEHDTEIKASSNPLQTFCQIFYDEAVAEGVDPGVVFAQAMKETGFLRFGGDVKIEQYNFCGLGATGGGAAGQAFGSVRLGVRAQVQHLKAYASQEDLKNAVVDPRFQYVTRGCATFAEYLGIQENPWGKGWATASNYGYSIVNDYMYKFCTVKKTSSTANSFLNVAYSTHVQSYGWQADKFNGMTSGTTGLGKRLEAIKIKVSGAYDLGVTYQTHVQTFGWGDWVADGDLSGTTGQAKRLEAIRIKLTGNDADKFDVYYRVHAQTFGWLGWAKNGETAGTSGFAKRLEAIQIYVVPKGMTPSSGTSAVSYVQYGKAASKSDQPGLINYATHVQTYGNQQFVSDGSFSGTYGEAKRLEAIRIQVNNEAKYGHSTLYNVFYEKFLNQRIKKYVLSEYAEKISEKMQLENIKRQLEKNEVYICYATMQYRGEIFHKKFRFVYLDDKKETILLSQMDVTEQIEREEKKNDAVKIAVQEARKANESKSYFLSRMSHDMRTPLNAIIGMDMIAASHINETDKVMESLNSILYSSKNLLELVNEVLDVSNFERGKFSLNDAVFSWTKEIENIMQLIRPLADKKHLEFDTDYKKLRFENVVGDAKRIRQLCINLLSNAVKYTEDGGKIYFSISERRRDR